MVAIPEQHEVDLVTLEKICRDQGQPFHWLSHGTQSLHRQLKSLTGVTPMSPQSGAMFCGRVSDAIIFGKSYVKDGHPRAAFAHQSHRNYMPKEFAHYYKAEIIKETRARANIEEECCFLGGYSGNTKFFGHFIYEFLFRLFAFEKCGLLDRFPLAVYEGIPDSWLSFIELYGLPKDRILKIPQYPAPLFRNVWVTSSPIAAWMPGYSYWDEGIREVRERLLAAAGRVGGDGPKRIFIGRRDAAHRRLLNEAEVWAFLKTQGFEYIEFAGKTAAEQVRLVRSAEIVVTVAGSASAMTAFAPLDSIIISMQPANLGGAFGPMGVATVLGQTYERLPRAMSQDSPNDGVDVDFVVTLGEVQDVVQQAIRLTESHRPNPKSLQSPN